MTRATLYMHRVPRVAHESSARTCVRARSRETSIVSLSLSLSFNYRSDIDLSRYRGSIRGAK